MCSIQLSKSVPDFNNLFDENFHSDILSMKRMKDYKILKYDKNALNHDIESSFGLCRSIVFNDENRVVVYSPPKSLQRETFVEKYPSLNNEDFIVEEFVEGTMINMFYNKDIWEISTRGVVGANTRFFKSSDKTTFRKMFFETFHQSGINYDMLNKDYCYSFVLQHPENRIVVPFAHPALKLVGVYHIETLEGGNVVVNVIDKYSHWLNELSSSIVETNNVYETESYSHLDEKYASHNTPYYVVGYIVYHKATGERMKVRNPNYEEVKALRGNQTKLQFQYLSLRSQGKVKDYLKYYPESKQDFSNYRKDVHDFTSTLYENYRSCYVKREKPLKEYGNQFRTHMYHIHQIFLTELKEEKKYVDIQLVIQYVNGLKPDYLMYSLNYHHRKGLIDVKGNEHLIME